MSDWDERWKKALAMSDSRLRGAAIGTLIESEEHAVRRAVCQDFADEFREKNRHLKNTDLALMILERGLREYPSLFTRRNGKILGERAIRRYLQGHHTQKR